MSVVVEGPSDAATVVLVHGVGLDHEMWAPVAVELAEHHRVVRYDLRGHGDAPSLDEDADLGTFAAQLEAVVDELGLGSFVLVGFSLGALIAQRFALDHPERVEALVLAHSVFDRSPADRAAVLGRVEAVRDGRYASTIERALQRWFTPDFAAAHPMVVDSVRQRLLHNDVSSYVIAYSIFATADAGLAAEVGEISSPTLVLTGAEDSGSTPAMTFALANAIPNARAAIVPGVRHLAPLQDPHAIAAMIEAFVAAVMPATRPTHRENA
jgi:pimeloyl-ACP methyl ester carboxylesterase